MIEVVTFNNVGTLSDFDFYADGWRIVGTDTYGESLNFRLQFSTVSGNYSFKLQANGNYLYTHDGAFGSSVIAYTDISQLPWPSEWYMNEAGIFFDVLWPEDDWPFYATYMHILPYWHYAE